MFTYKDVDVRSIFIINCIERKRSLRVYNGELLLEENEDSKSKTLTKFPFQKLFCFVRYWSYYCYYSDYRKIQKIRCGIGGDETKSPSSVIFV